MVFMRHGDVHIYRLRIQFFTLALGLLLLLSSNSDNILLIRKLIVFAVLLAVINNLLNFMYPHMFSSTPQYLRTGRSSGFYANPNEAGAAIIYGMIVCFNVVPKRLRYPFLASTFAGVLMTFSRGAILGWFIVIVLMLWKGNLRFQKTVLMLIGFVVAAVFVWPLMNTFLINHQAGYFDVYNRVQWFVSGGQTVDFSEAQRLLVLKTGWNLFLMHPWIGNGIGATYTWSLPVSTHNMYLLFMTDYGIIGLPLFITFAIVPIIGAHGEAKIIAIPFAIFILYWGFFDHNMLDNFYSVFTVIVMASMTRQSVVMHRKRNTAKYKTSINTQAISASDCGDISHQTG